MSQKEEIKDVTRSVAKVAAEASWPQTRVVLRVIIIVLAVAVTIWVVVKLTAVILLLVLSIFFAYLVSPLVDFLRKPIRISGRERVMPRILAISLAYLIIVGAIVLAFYVLLPRLGNQFPEFANQSKAYWKSFSDRTQEVIRYSRRLPAPVVDALNNASQKATEKVSTTTTEFATAALGYVIYIPWLIFGLFPFERCRGFSSLSFAHASARPLALARR